MSPELILMGYTSKATDVFAAGVLLYILLSGRPPFHSKSNREVLEKTAKGQYSLTGPSLEISFIFLFYYYYHYYNYHYYLLTFLLFIIIDYYILLALTFVLTAPQKTNHNSFIICWYHLSVCLSGGEWALISDEAKDLVRKMLVSNPEQRITTEEILKHPWLDLDQDLDTETVQDTLPEIARTGGVSTAITKKVSRRGSNTNLTGTLRQLSGHVKNMRSEKLASNVRNTIILIIDIIYHYLMIIAICCNDYY